MPAPATGTVRMTLRINGFEYVVHPLGVDFSCRRYLLRKREGGRYTEQYTVRECNQGTMCDCPDFRTRRHRKDPDGCKHIKALRAFYMVC